jgi:hypothetical protein
MDKGSNQKDLGPKFGRKLDRGNGQKEWGPSYERNLVIIQTKVTPKIT